MGEKVDLKEFNTKINKIKFNDSVYNTEICSNAAILMNIQINQWNEQYDCRESESIFGM